MSRGVSGLRVVETCSSETAGLALLELLDTIAADAQLRMNARRSARGNGYSSVGKKHLGARSGTIHERKTRLDNVRACVLLCICHLPRPNAMICTARQAVIANQRRATPMARHRFERWAWWQKWCVLRTKDTRNAWQQRKLGGARDRVNSSVTLRPRARLFVKAVGARTHAHGEEQSMPTQREANPCTPSLQQQ